jgi:hypothetical protein
MMSGGQHGAPPTITSAIAAMDTADIEIAMLNEANLRAD